jgi:tRNA A37 N6-isopentenylltransferase MiaA
MPKRSDAESRAAREELRDEVSNYLVAMLKEQDLDAAADYVRRGRPHRALSDAELIETWKAAFRSFSHEPNPGPLRTAIRELQAELDLRK